MEKLKRSLEEIDMCVEALSEFKAQTEQKETFGFASSYEVSVYYKGNDDLMERDYIKAEVFKDGKLISVFDEWEGAFEYVEFELDVELNLSKAEEEETCDVVDTVVDANKRLLSAKDGGYTHIVIKRGRGLFFNSIDMVIKAGIENSGIGVEFGSAKEFMEASGLTEDNFKVVDVISILDPSRVIDDKLLKFYAFELYRDAEEAENVYTNEFDGLTYTELMLMLKYYDEMVEEFGEFI